MFSQVCCKLSNSSMVGFSPLTLWHVVVVFGKGCGARRAFGVSQRRLSLSSEQKLSISGQVPLEAGNVLVVSLSHTETLSCLNSVGS